MRKFLFGFCTILVLCSLFISPVNAQESTNGTQAPDNESVIQIDKYVRVVDYELNENTIEIVVFSEQESRPIKLTDMNSGKGKTGAYTFDTKTVQLSYEKNTITMELEQSQGRVEVSLATFGGTVGIAKGTESNLFSGEYAGESLIVSAVGGGFVAITMLIGVAFRREDKINNSFEREL